MRKQAMLLLAAITFVGCNGGPTSPDTAKRNCALELGCTDNNVRPLTPEAEKAEIDRARADVARELGKPITSPDPRVRYVACPFFVPNSTFGDVCAAGMAKVNEGYIQVMTFDGPRIAPLVHWEAKNWFYVLNGARDRAV